jgi:uncharacterized repeat protein (TIGR01451 family)
MWMLIAMVSGMLPPPTARAIGVTIVVTEMNDAINAVNGCASSTAPCSIRDAVIYANATAGDDIITLPAGTITLSVSGSDEDAATLGDLDITESVAINGDPSSGTTLQAGGGFADRIIQIVSTGATLSMTRVTLKNGAPDGTNNDGGAIKNHGTLALTDVTIQNSAASNPPFTAGEGGAIWSDGNVTLLRVTLDNNHADRGGGIKQAGGTLSITDSTLTSNGAPFGGAIAHEAGAGALTILRSTIASNDAGFNVGGGGGGITSDAAGGTVSITESTVAFNTSGGSGGGGLFVGVNSAGARLVNSTISSNQTNGNGGGLTARTTNAVQLSSVTVALNVAGAGGSPGDGGGVFALPAANVTLRNTIVAQDSDASGNTGTDCFGPIGSDGYNLIGSNHGCTFAATTGDLVSHPANLGPIGDHGGPTHTHEPQTGSEAIDAGNPAGCKDSLAATLTTDQRGSPRSTDGDGDTVARCDIGAYETDASVAAPSLAFTTQPGNGTAGSPISPQPVLEKRLAGGGRDTAYNGTVTIQLANNPSGATLGGTTTVNAVSGVATFTNLSLDKSGTGYTLAAQAGSTSAISQAFNITAGGGGTQAHLAITLTGGESFSPGAAVTYTVTARNNGPSAVTGASVQVGFPTGIARPSWTCAGTGAGACAGSVTNGVGNIDVQVNLPASATVTFSATTSVACSAAGAYPVTATISAPTGIADTNSGNNSATVPGNTSGSPAASCAVPGARQPGQLWLYTPKSLSEPARLQPAFAPSNVIEYDGSLIHALFVTADGAVWGYGDNSTGQLGDGNYWHVGTDASTAPEPGTPVQVRNADGSPFTGVRSVQATGALSGGSFALKTDGTVWVWGSSEDMLLGRNPAGAVECASFFGVIRCYPNPVKINTDAYGQPFADVIAISVTETHALALKNDGSVWAWGFVTYGQLGVREDGLSPDFTKPARVIAPRGNDGHSHGFLTDIVAIKADSENSFALKRDGTVFAWGNNGSTSPAGGIVDNNLLGIGVRAPDTGCGPQGGNECSFAPLQMRFQNGQPFDHVKSLGGFFLREDGSLWDVGTIDHSTDVQRDPFPVKGPDGQPISGIVEVPRNGVYGRRADGSVVTTDGTLANLDGSPFIVSSVVGGGGSVGLLRSDTDTTPGVVAPTAPPAATLYDWGDNSSGQLGDGTTEYHVSPSSFARIGQVRHIAGGGDHTLAVGADGIVYAWGRNDVGQLGNGQPGNPVTTPQPVRGRDSDRLTQVAFVAAGEKHSLALTTDGHVLSWGGNDQGQLGDGTTANHSTPILINGLDGVVAIAANGSFSMALKGDGTVWAWGANDKGQLGDGTTTGRRTPVRVNFLTGMVGIAAGSNFGLAVMSPQYSGAVFAWGDNSHGQLGDHTQTSRSRPDRVRSTGDGKIPYAQSSPGTIMTQVAAGLGQALALQYDYPHGVFGWGSGANGELGDGSTSDQTEPVSVNTDSGQLVGITQIAAGGYHSLALLGNGEGTSVYTWGRGTLGELGDGTGRPHARSIKIDLRGTQFLAAGRRFSLASSVLSGPVRTVLGQPVSAGATCIPAPSTLTVTAGSTIRLNPGGTNQEDAKVITLGGPSSNCAGTHATASANSSAQADTGLTLAQPLKFSHAPDEPIITVTSDALVPCATRLEVKVQAAPDGAGNLRVTLTAQLPTPDSANRLKEVRFGAATNARIDVGDKQGQPGSFTYTPPGSTQTLTFTVHRAQAGQATQVPIVVVDGCGEWPSFVGGGPAAF